MVEQDERRCQRRLVVVLFREAVPIETPRLDADVLYGLKRVTATVQTHPNRAYDPFFLNHFVTEV